MLELSGDEDVLPFLTLRNAKDEVAYIGLVLPPPGDEGRDQIADAVTAACMVYRPVEAAFACLAWLVIGEDALRCLPSEHPDRVESAVVISVDDDGNINWSHANVIRENNKVGVGLWSEEAGESTYVKALGGRFASAISRGMFLAKHLPPDLAAHTEREIEAGRITELIQMAVGVIDTVRKTVRKTAGGPQ